MQGAWTGEAGSASTTGSQHQEAKKNAPFTISRRADTIATAVGAGGFCQVLEEDIQPRLAKSRKDAESWPQRSDQADDMREDTKIPLFPSSGFLRIKKEIQKKARLDTEVFIQNRAHRTNFSQSQLLCYSSHMPLDSTVAANTSHRASRSACCVPEKPTHHLFAVTTASIPKPET
jgi:hypothetical protein